MIPRNPLLVQVGYFLQPRLIRQASSRSGVFVYQLALLARFNAGAFSQSGIKAFLRSA